MPDDSAKLSEAFPFQGNPKTKRPPPRKAPALPVSAVGRSDKPASHDFLDRKIYVTALAALILNPKTQAPLTIGIYGPWGSGKSSFLAQLTECLPKRFMVAKFNPWRLSGSGEVWADLVSEIAPIIDRHLGLLQRLRFLWSSDPTRSIGKLRTRLTAASKKISNWLTLATTSGGLLAAGYLGDRKLPDIVTENLAADGWVMRHLNGALAVFGNYDLGAVKWDAVIGRVSAGILAAFVLYKILRTLFRPFSTQFRANLSQFKEDSQDLKSATFKDFEALRKVVGNFTAKRAKQNKPPLILLIDDLDRCSPDRVVAVLEAVNQFIAELPIITVFAIDTKFVCSAVAARHRFLFAPPNDTAKDREFYGRLFLEKIIHIPFQLPTVQSYEHYIEDLLTISTDDAQGRAREKPKKPPLMPKWKEAMGDHKGLDKLLANALYCYLMPLCLSLAPTSDIEVRWIWSITTRIAFGLYLTDEQRNWLRTQDTATQILIGFQETEFHGRLLNPVTVSSTVKRAQQEVLATTIKIEENDRAILRAHTGNLQGNPRSIKRFVNTYLLAKGINALATLDKTDDIRLENLAAWLVLLQNWPRAASILCAQAHAEKPRLSLTDDWVTMTLQEHPPAEMLAFVQSNRARLESLVASSRGLDIARCFSFFTVEA